MNYQRKNLILDTVDDLVTSLLWDDRKEDEDLPRGEIETALAAGEITIEEIITQFRHSLTVKAKPTAPAQDEYPMDVCPACGYIGAMGINLMRPDTGPVTWLRCHRCGTDRALPDLPGETP